MATKAAQAVKKRAGTVGNIGAKQANGFVTFLREQGVVGLAVGLAIGAAAGDTVKKLVAAFINPIIQLLVGTHETLETAKWTLEIEGRKGTFEWGAFVSSLISLVATAFVIYIIVHYARLDRLDKKKG